MQESGDVQIWFEDLWHLPAHLSWHEHISLLFTVRSGWFHLQACKVNGGRKGLLIYILQYCKNTCNLLAPAPSVHRNSVLTRKFEIKLQVDFASFCLVWCVFLVQHWKNGTVMMSGNPYCIVASLSYAAMNVFFSLPLPRFQGIPPRFHWPEWGSAATIAARTATRIWETCYRLRLDAEDELLRKKSDAPRIVASMQCWGPFFLAQACQIAMPHSFKTEIWAWSSSALSTE